MTNDTLRDSVICSALGAFLDDSDDGFEDVASEDELDRLFALFKMAGGTIPIAVDLAKTMFREYADKLLETSPATEPEVTA